MRSSVRPRAYSSVEQEAIDFDLAVEANDVVVHQFLGDEGDPAPVKVGPPRQNA